MFLSHTPKNIIYLSGTKLTLEKMQELYPDYKLPTGAIGQYYDTDREVHFLLMPNRKRQNLPYPNEDIEIYLSEKDSTKDIVGEENIDLEREVNTQKASDIVESFREIATGKAGKNKVAAWATKVPRAERIVNNTAYQEDIDALEQEIAHREDNPTVQELANTILQRAAALSRKAGAMEGAENKAINKINKATYKEIKGILDDLKQELKEILLEP